MTTETDHGVAFAPPAWASAAFVFDVGVWLAVLQVALFLSLELLLSSAFLTYVTVVFAWLIGAAAGVWLPRGRWTLVLLAASGAAPYLSLWLLRLAPFNTGLILVHGLLVAITALYAGQLYQQERSSFRQIGTLFFWENNGFIVGLIAAVLGFVLAGRSFLHAAPPLGLLAVVLVGLGRRALPVVQVNDDGPRRRRSGPESRSGAPRMAVSSSSTPSRHQRKPARSR
jgi:hypothetical protein